MNSEPMTKGLRLEPLLEAFRRASLSPSAGYRLVKAGGFPKLIKRGRRSYVVAAEVDAWIQALVDGPRTEDSP